MKIESMNNTNFNKRKTYGNIRPSFTGALSVPLSEINTGMRGIGKCSPKQKFAMFVKKISEHFHLNNILKDTANDFGELISDNLLLINKDVPREMVINTNLNLIIGLDVKIAGKINTEGDVTIKGKVLRRGEVNADGDMIIKDTAVIDGTIFTVGKMQLYGYITPKGRAVGTTGVIYEGATIDPKASIEFCAGD